MISIKSLAQLCLKKLEFDFFWCLIVGLLFLPSTSQAVFTTPSNFGVTAKGEASLSIPVEVVPGTSGMLPKLSLVYNSASGNGILGKGWGLDGLSQIGRCPQTLIQDGVIRGVNYDANDKFCIDGQRLISTGAAYGADGTEYRTQIANFAKIISYGVTGTGPARFKVWTRDGRMIDYGSTANSAIAVSGGTTIRTWGASQITDTKGNYMTMT